MSTLSPRGKLINSFKVHSKDNYNKIFMKCPNKEVLEIKLKSYVLSLFHIINNKANIELKKIDDEYYLFKDGTLIANYSFDNVYNIYTENQLGLSLFIEYGYLLDNLDKVREEQLLLAL